MFSIFLHGILMKKIQKHGIYFKEQAEMLNNYCNINILNIERISVKFLSKFFNFILKRNKFIISGNIVNYKYLDYTLKNIELRVKLFEKNVLKSFELYLKSFSLPEVIHAQVTYPAGYAAFLIGKKYNVPFIVTEHSSNFENYYSLFNKIL